MKLSVAVRYFSLARDGELLRLPQVFIHWIHKHPRRVRATAFAGRTLRLVETAIQVDDGKPVAIIRLTCNLIRFDEAGHPDLKRFLEESCAGRPDLLDPSRGKAYLDGNVLHMERAFVGNGCKWVPTIAERILLERAALGLTRPPSLGPHWREKSGV